MDFIPDFIPEPSAQARPALSTNIRIVSTKTPEDMPAMTLEFTITRSGLVVKYDAVSKAVGKKLSDVLNAMKISHTATIGNTSHTKTIAVYRIVRSSGGLLLNVARFAGIRNLLTRYNSSITFRFVNAIQPGRSITITQSVDLEAYQALCLDYMMENVYNRIQSGIAACTFVMNTGLGKTFVAGGLIERLKVKTLIIIPNSSNLSGWEAPFRSYLTAIKLGGYHSKLREDGDVVIMIVNSALKDTFKFRDREVGWQDYFREFGLVIFDEIHDFPTATRQEIFWRTVVPAVLGLTATPDERLDNMDEVYYKHVGPLIRAEDIPGFGDYINETRFNGSVQVHEYYGPPEYTERITSVLDTVSMPEMQKQFAADPWRNQLVFNLIIDCFNRGRNTFVFAEHRGILNEMYAAVKQYFGNNTIEMTTYMGGSDQESHEIAYKSARIIFTTLRFGKQSISIVRMDTIILMQPIRNKMRQLIGRILRRGGDISIAREMHDIRDMNTSVKSQFDTRKNIYMEKQFAITVTKIRHDAIELKQFRAPGDLEGHPASDQ